MFSNGVPVSLIDDGILWLINRVIFHPRGFALAVDKDGNFFLCGDGTEPHAFHHDIGEGELFARVEAAFDRARKP